jgi:hypothetical protein
MFLFRTPPPLRTFVQPFAAGAPWPFVLPKPLGGPLLSCFGLVLRGRAAPQGRVSRTCLPNRKHSQQDYAFLFAVQRFT